MRIVSIVLIVLAYSANALGQETTTERPANCAAPKRLIGSDAGSVTWSDFQTLRADFFRLENYVSQLQKLRGIPGQPGPKGDPGPAGAQGPRGEPGPRGFNAETAQVGDIEERLHKLEKRLDLLINQLNAKFGKKRSSGDSGGSPAISEERVGQQSESDERPGWLVSILKPAARIVGTAYAGPFVGFLAASGVGMLGWFFTRSKNKPRPIESDRPAVFSSSPAPISIRTPASGYTGEVVRSDGSSERCKPEPDPDLWKEAAIKAASGSLNVLGERHVGEAIFNYVAKKFAARNNQF